MQQIGRMDEIKRTERIVHHCYNMVFFKDSSTMNRIENLLEVRLNELNNEEDLFEAFDTDVLEVIQLLRDYIFTRHRWGPSIGWISGLHITLCHIEAWCYDIIKLRSEHVILHERKLTQNLNLSQNFACWILVIKSIANLFYGDLFLWGTVPRFNNSSETAFTTDLEKLKIGLDTRPDRWQLHHLPSFVTKKACFFRIFLISLLLLVPSGGQGIRSGSICIIHLFGSWV